MPTPNPLLSLPVLRSDLERVEEGLRAAVISADPFLTEIASHLMKAGGKRVRPAFSLVAAATPHAQMAPAGHDVVQGAIAVELVHLGSLYHDDVMDHAAMRRTVESVNARWGNLKAILAGDYLLAKASEIAAAIGTEVAGLLAATIARLCEGQVLELQHAFDVDRSEESYMTAIAGKTAALLASACRIGALTGALPGEQVDALTRFGRGYGMAFQVVDDVLDVVATPEAIGKPVGHDLVEGIYTLPVIRTLTEGSGAAADQLRDLLGEPLGSDQLEVARKVVRESGGVESALVTARGFVDEALASLEALPDGEATASLRSAATHLLDTVTSLPS